MHTIGHDREKPQRLALHSDTLRGGVLYELDYQGMGRARARLDFSFSFSDWDRRCINPEMTLAILLDRSRWLYEAYRNGEVRAAASAILQHVEAAGGGFELVLYDEAPRFAGPIAYPADLRRALEEHGPRGDTWVMRTALAGALQGAIERFGQRGGLYLIVVTTGEVTDQDELRRLVLDTLVPRVTPDSPYAFRLHLIGFGGGADPSFLGEIRDAARRASDDVVWFDTISRLREARAVIIERLNSVFTVFGHHARFEVRAPSGSVPAAELPPGEVYVEDLRTRRGLPGTTLPLGVLTGEEIALGLRFDPARLHLPALEVVLRYGVGGGTEQSAQVQVPLAQATVTSAEPEPAARDTWQDRLAGLVDQATASAAAAASPPPAPRRGWLHLPWRRPDPDERAAAEAAAQQQAAPAQRSEEVRQAGEHRRAEDERLLGAGGIPSRARQRLAALRDADPALARFTSNLSPDEAALLRRTGCRPLGLVGGSAMYRVGVAYASIYSDCEVTELSQAYKEATRLAVSRLEQEAGALGAHGVIGVRLEMVRHAWGEKSIEVRLLGTAIAEPGPAPARPWLSDLSGHEWWALRRAGYEPAGLVYGHCTWFILTTQDDEQTERDSSNRELRHQSVALAQCRTRAVEMIAQMAGELHATGVVGVHLSRRLEEIRLSGTAESAAYEREHHHLTLSLVGTAVRLRPDPPEALPASTLVLSLRGGGLLPTRVAAGVERRDERVPGQDQGPRLR